MKYRLLFFLALLLHYAAGAQDALFSQYYFSPVYLNPAFTGCAKNNVRFSGAAKMQWINLNQSYKYVTGAADMSVYDDHLRNICNLGGIVTHTSKGFLKNTNISAIVGRSFGTGNEDCSDWFLSLAIQAGYTFNNVNNNYLIFSDQLDQNGINGNPSQVDLFQNGNTAKNYFEMSSGFVFTIRNFMFGGAVHHINEPEISFQGASADSKLPRKITAHIGYLWDGDYLNLKPAVIASFQGKSSVVSIGSLIDLKEFPIELGIWYRNNTGFVNNHTFSIGFNWKWQSSKVNNYNSNGYEYATKFGLNYDAEAYKPAINTTHGSMGIGFQKDVIVNEDIKCPTATSGICTYRFPWEFF